MKTKSIFLTLSFALLAYVGFSQGGTTTGMTLNTTAHNFYNGVGGYTFANVAGEGACNVCHTPHNATSTNLPLWDHTAPDAATFQTYTSGTLQGTTNLATSGSLLCLGCHDGSANLDAYGGAARDDAGQIWDPTDTYAVFGTDLRNDHPIGITYDSANDLQLVDETNSAGLAQTGSIAELMLTNGTTVDCSSCHSLHNPAAGAAAIGSLLRKDNSGSALCLTCHAK